jgi:putative FmdB family regulatory protein
MATYGYRCPRDGAFDVVRPMGTALPSESCPSCGTPASRQWTPPLLSTADRRAMALVDSTKATAERPAVVDAPPPRPRDRRRTVTTRENPRLARLPRP